MVMGGIDNSPEGIQVSLSTPINLLDFLVLDIEADNLHTWKNGFTHAFISEFENEEDRKYYLEKDPEHLAVIDSVADIEERVQVIDFVPGVF
jgi:hypothetical protein